MAVKRKNGGAMAGFVRPPGKGCASLVDRVYDRILLRIVRGELGGGAELKSTRLARDLGVSRTPVVQALQRLEADGIVVHEVNRRAVVRPGAENWLMEVHRLRELLEPEAAAMAATRIGDEVVAGLRALGERARPGRRGWALAAREFDYALHLAIAEHCGNMPLAEAIRRCWGFKRASYEAGREDPAWLARGHEQHMAILDALARRDPQTALAAAQFHLRSAASFRPAEKIV
ncbi:MAG: GntR family transcriptional regulator [Verrucomicrobiae bacterium]|nr:GntR family transcriptional regulator [Verrucomicrobiae bacterium]